MVVYLYQGQCETMGGGAVVGEQMSLDRGANKHRGARVLLRRTRPVTAAISCLAAQTDTPFYRT